MNQQQRVVQYVLENGPCTESALYLELKAAGRMIQRSLVDGAPEGMVACERKQRTDDGTDEYIFKFAESPPDGFELIKIRGRHGPVA